MQSATIEKVVLQELTVIGVNEILFDGIVIELLVGIGRSCGARHHRHGSTLEMIYRACRCRSAAKG